MTSNWGKTIFENKSHVNGLLKKLFFSYLLAIGIFGLYRLIFLASNGTMSIYKSHKVELLEALLMGIRFDTVIILYSLLPLILLTFSFLIIPVKINLRVNRVLTYYKHYLKLIFSIFIICTIIDFHYYQFFKSRINVHFFAFLNDDINAVLGSVFTDFPIWLILIITTILCITNSKAINFIFSKN